MGEEKRSAQDYYLLTEEQIDSYRVNGYIRLENVVTSEEISYYRPLFLDVVQRLNNPSRPHNERYFYGTALQHTINTWRRNKAISEFVLAKKYAQIAAQLMGVEKVRLNHDCVLFKEPGAKKTPWHIDQVPWSLETKHTITMWAPLVDVKVDMGTMIYFPGSHHWDDIRQKPLKVLHKEVKDKGLQLVSCGDMKAGDVTFHSGWLLHGAGENRTHKTREVVTIVYYGDTEEAIVVAPEDDETRQSHMRRFFPGLKNGDRAISPLNPVLYP